MPEQFDIAIIGGGPAGTSAAIMLKKRHADLSILVLEASQYDSWRVGESLHPDAGKAFRELEVWDGFLDHGPQEAIGNAAAWESGDIRINEFIHHPEGKGWHLDRVAFDQWMAEEAQKKGIFLWKGCRYHSHQQLSNGSLSLSIRQGEEELDIKTSFVLDASGRSAYFASNEARKKNVYDRLSAAIGFFTPTTTHAELKHYTLVETQASGWWYSAQLPNQEMLLSFMTDADLLKDQGLHKKESFTHLLSQSIHTKQRVESPYMLKDVQILSAASFIREKICGLNWIAIGDAASTFDPLSSHGIYKAIRSGMFGAYAVSDYLRGIDTIFSKYQRFIQEEYKEYLKKRQHFYRIVRRWPESEFWKRRQ